MEVGCQLSPAESRRARAPGPAFPPGLPASAPTREVPESRLVGRCAVSRRPLAKPGEVPGEGRRFLLLTNRGTNRPVARAERARDVGRVRAARYLEDRHTPVPGHSKLPGIGPMILEGPSLAFHRRMYTLETLDLPGTQWASRRCSNEMTNGIRLSATTGKYQANKKMALFFLFPPVLCFQPASFPPFFAGEDSWRSPARSPGCCSLQRAT